MMAGYQQNPLLSSQKSDSGVHVSLHPLVLLTISDYITRHTLRRLNGPVVGALLGQQNGREVTVEHAFECKMVEGTASTLDMEWFDTRLLQMKEVHKVPVLDLVGWYTLVPTAGPQPHHATIQTKLSDLYSESTILLGFHPSAVLEGSVGGKLPLTVYEANVEPPEPNASEDVEMSDGQPIMRVTFKELPYSVETGEAEMIAVDFVAKGGGNATAVPNTGKAPQDTSSQQKGKKKAEVPNADKLDDENVLSREEEELVAALTAKANAIKMLQSRINLVSTYLEKLPPSYMSIGTAEAGMGKPDDYTHVEQSILRSIQALLHRLPLLIPSDSMVFNQELLVEENDVNLVSLLSTLTENITDAAEVGRKFAIVEAGHRFDKSGVSNKSFWGINSNSSGAQDLATLTGAGDLMTRF